MKRRDAVSFVLAHGFPSLFFDPFLSKRLVTFYSIRLSRSDERATNRRFGPNFLSPFSSFFLSPTRKTQNYVLSNQRESWLERESTVDRFVPTDGDTVARGILVTVSLSHRHPCENN